MFNYKFMSRYHLNNLKILVILGLGFWLVAIFNIYYFSKIHTLIYRVVEIFLSLIIITNFGAKLLIFYFKNNR